MKIDYGSDLHLAFDKESNRIIDCFPAKRAPTLILAGDIAEISYLKGKKCHIKTQIEHFFRWVSSNYETVVYVMGNHEFYDIEINFAIQNLRTIFAKMGLSNIKILENETIELSDAVIFGGTMWTSMRNGNPQVMAAVQGGMNDYRSIKYVDQYKEKSFIQPEYTAGLHRRTISALTKFIDTKHEKTKVVVTHHAPHIGSIDEWYRTNSLNDAYYEELFDLIHDSDIHSWIHGHTHTQSEYTIGNTNILANPRGYWGYEAIANNYNIKTFTTG